MPPDLKKYERLAKAILDSLHYEVVITSSRFEVQNQENYRFVLFEGIYECDWKRGVFCVWGIITPDENLLLTAPQDENGRAIPRRGFRARNTLAPEDANNLQSRQRNSNEERAVQVMGSNGVSSRNSSPREVRLDASAKLCDRHGRLLPRANSRNQLPI